MLIGTERLTITTFTEDMAHAVHVNSLDDDVRRFLPDEVFETEEEAADTIRFLMSQYEACDGPLVYPVLVKENGANVGYVQLVPTGNGEWEIGYHIGRQYTGRGYATEAIKAFLPFMAQKLGLVCVYGICLSENAASLRVLEKCGFVRIFTGIDQYQGYPREVIKAIWNG